MRPAVRSSRTRAIVWALAFAVWVATTLGLVHGTLHHPGTAHAAAASDPADQAGGSHSAAVHGLAALFADHADDDADCRLYDQLSHGAAALSVPPVILPVMLPAATFAWLEGEFVARWVALFDARGPPSIR